ncbi:MAG: 30S ribosomal protein S18 [Oscillospiraceae bacterium]|nr:30S ribosomal protein S18 [Oscillospiraceae bacterium]
MNKIYENKKSYNDRNNKRRMRKKVCSFCVDRTAKVNFKEALYLRRFMSERAKILPRRVTGVCARHQRILSTAIKQARFLALLPYVNG